VDSLKWVIRVHVFIEMSISTHINIYVYNILKNEWLYTYVYNILKKGMVKTVE
jgi:hypothetical protein